MRAIKATSLHRKVTKPLKSWEKQEEDKSRGWRGEGRHGRPTATVYLRDLPPLPHTCTPLGAEESASNLTRSVRTTIPNYFGGGDSSAFTTLSKSSFFATSGSSRPAPRCSI